MGGTLDPYGNPQGAMQQPNQPFQTFASDPSKARGAGGELLSSYVGHPIHNDIKAWNEIPNLQKPHTGIARPNDLMQPIGGLTHPQQQQALQWGLGALQGPTQQKIKQGYQV